MNAVIKFYGFVMVPATGMCAYSSPGKVAVYNSHRLLSLGVGGNPYTPELAPAATRPAACPPAVLSPVAESPNHARA